MFALYRSRSPLLAIFPHHHPKLRGLRAMADGSAAVLATRVGFIGAGQMAEAIARGLHTAGVLPASRMYAADVNASRCKVFESFGANACSSNAQVAENSDVLILAVKPQVAEKVLLDLRPKLTKEHLLVSIAAGITISNLQKWAGDARIVRVMPNTPCLVGETAAAFSLGDEASEKDANVVKTLFQAVGKIFVVEEKLLNAVTGLSGSGPAYIYLAIEALADGGVAAGLPRAIALSLAAQTECYPRKVLFLLRA
ncbi:hypothetical protein O6H91_04G065500 [Diphasiastrum complanatum]|uniref:Uncharacterized protein n=1 Tax=Diphasiastrum complanatum TaxID=34168 RepID=A0ACC2DXN1_DIPCM|nr:hypothetical protein O6H91_04G065500 [Diphasiastrum complanatum]